MKSLPEFSVRNPVAVNIIAVFLFVMGGYYAVTLIREFFPPTDPEIVYVGMSYPGSTPEEVERGITKRIEDALLDLEGIDKVTSNITEGNSGTIVEMQPGYDKRKLIDAVQREIDRITDFPDEALDPIVIDIEFSIPVISVVIHGTASEQRLKDVAEELEDAIRERVRLSSIATVGARSAELAVEVDPAKLVQYNLTFGEVSEAIRRSNFDLPGGEIKAAQGQILLRTLGESDTADRLRRVVLRSADDGTFITVDNVASVTDGFSESKQFVYFKGERAVALNLYKNRDQDAIAIAAAAQQVVEEHRELYSGEAITIDCRADSSRFINQRQQLLLRNGLQGLVLVFFALALFLEIRVAFWVAAGVPTAFVGTFVLMKLFGITVNMISLFGLIIVIGIVVDDAIVIGENIYRHLEEGMPPHRAAIEGAKEVTWPVIASVATTIVAFIPLMFLGGVIGDFLGQIPVVVIAALSVSLVEALVILPSHMAETFAAVRARELSGKGWKTPAWAHRVYEAKEDFLGRALPDFYIRWLKFTLEWRYIFIASMIGVLIISLGFVGSGLVKFVLFQNTDSETVIVELEMSAGTPAEATAAVIDRVRLEALKLPETDSVLTLVGAGYRQDGGGTSTTSENKAQLVIDLLPAEQRDERGLADSTSYLDRLRLAVGPVPGATNLKYASAQGGPPGGDIELELRAPEWPILERVTREARLRLATYDGVADIEDTMQLGKSEVRLRLLPAAESLGLTTRDLALQVRGAFFGDEAQSLQRDSEEVKVYVRLTRAAREQLQSLEDLWIKTASGARVPLREVASLEMTRGYSLLTRIDGRRAVKVSADVIEARANTTEVVNDLIPWLDQLARDTPGLTYSFAGEKKKTTDAFANLKFGIPAALMGIYVILAIIFHSYTQPLIIMTAIPFGVVGAIWGHPIMGYPITVLSIIGIVALSGIVVNDSLVLVDFVNEEVRKRHTDLHEAIMRAGRTRLRPILLTSITTVFGLAPLMAERSFQAQFLIPMAVSISFGLTFATVITLLLVPCLYLFIEDVRSFYGWLRTGHWEAAMPIGMRRALLEQQLEESYREVEAPKA